MKTHVSTHRTEQGARGGHTFTANWHRGRRRERWGEGRSLSQRCRQHRAGAQGKPGGARDRSRSLRARTVRGEHSQRRRGRFPQPGLRVACEYISVKEKRNTSPGHCPERKHRSPLGVVTKAYFPALPEYRLLNAQGAPCPARPRRWQRSPSAALPRLPGAAFAHVRVINTVLMIENKHVRAGARPPRRLSCCSRQEPGASVGTRPPRDTRGPPERWRSRLAS